MPSRPAQITLTPIGHVRRDTPAPAGAGAFIDPAAPARLVILPDFAAGLDGIEAYSHLIVLCWFDRATRPDRLDAPIHPEGRADLPSVGLFATRSPHRPNPIALATPRLLSRDGHTLTVSGLDAWDGTPILDLKGYLPSENAHPDAAIPHWLTILHAIHADERP
jgi:formylmethanofuran dehydrogenase subunit E